MGTRNGRGRAADGSERGTTAGPRSASDALRKEAERRWAESDRKAAKAVRRAQVRAKRQGEADQRGSAVRGPKSKSVPSASGRGRKAK